MTIMNWALSPESAALISDTIATSAGEENSPCALMQKVWSVPHLGMMMGATNWPGATLAFANSLANGALVPLSIEHAARLAERLLPSFAKLLAGEADDTAFVTYLFGWSRADNRAVGYMFRSPDGCKAMRLPDVVCLSPPLPPSKDGLKTWLEIARA